MFSVLLVWRFFVVVGVGHSWIGSLASRNQGR